MKVLGVSPNRECFHEPFRYDDHPLRKLEGHCRFLIGGGQLGRGGKDDGAIMSVLEGSQFRSDQQPAEKLTIRMGGFVLKNGSRARLKKTGHEAPVASRADALKESVGTAAASFSVRLQ